MSLRPASYSGDTWRRPLTFENSIWSNNYHHGMDSGPGSRSGSGSGPGGTTGTGTATIAAIAPGAAMDAGPGPGPGAGTGSGTGINVGHDRNSISSISSLDYDRRNSYNDIYDNLNNFNMNFNPMNINNPMNSNQMNYGNYNSFNAYNNKQLELNPTNLKLINDYFEVDYHKRVKVDLNFLEFKFNNDDLVQLPKFPIENSIKNYQLVLIGFKAGRLDIFYTHNKVGHGFMPGNLEDYQVGDLVMVEADRGKDLGKVLKLNISIDEARLLKYLQYQEQQEALNDDDSLSPIYSPSNASNSSTINHPILHFPKSILGLANNHEILQILNKKQDEEKACRLCLSKINSNPFTPNFDNGLNFGNNLNLNTNNVNMKLIDAEYQFDRKKLIFYYSTNKRIDFRDLVKELFRIYKTRIWMCAVIGIPYVPPSQNQPNQPLGQVANQGQLATSNYYPSYQPLNYPEDVPRSSGIIDNDYKLNYIEPSNFVGHPGNISRGSGSIGSIASIGSIGSVGNNIPTVNGANNSNGNLNPMKSSVDGEDVNDELFVLKSLVDQIDHS